MSWFVNIAEGFHFKFFFFFFKSPFCLPSFHGKMPAAKVVRGRLALQEIVPSGHRSAAISPYYGCLAKDQTQDIWLSLRDDQLSTHTRVSNTNYAVIARVNSNKKKYHILVLEEEIYTHLTSPFSVFPSHHKLLQNFSFGFNNLSASTLMVPNSKKLSVLDIKSQNHLMTCRLNKIIF